jgi:hypothetical protein
MLTCGDSVLARVSLVIKLPVVGSNPVCFDGVEACQAAWNPCDAEIIHHSDDAL